MRATGAREKISNRDENPGFFKTTKSLPQEPITEPVNFSARVSRKIIVLNSAVAPIAASIRKIVRQEVYFNKSAPRTGATIGAIITMDMMVAITFSRSRPL